MERSQLSPSRARIIVAWSRSVVSEGSIEKSRGGSSSGTRGHREFEERERERRKTNGEDIQSLKRDREERERGERKIER